MKERWQKQIDLENQSKGLRKVRGSNGLFAYLYNSDDQIVEAEYYEPTGEFCGDLELVDVRIENAEGEVIAKHKTQRVSEDAYIINVLDHTGKLVVVLHHSDISRGEPFTIREEWVE